MTEGMDKKLIDFMGDSTGIAIIGLGNEYMGDDAAGMFAIRALDKVGVGAKLVEAGSDLMGAMHEVGDHEIRRALFIDAAGMSQEPGSVRALEESEVGGRCISTHDNNFPLALRYLRSLNPGAKVLFLGIQFQSLEMQEEPTLSPKVEEGVRGLVALIVSALSAGFE
ncbi:MAG: hydrogenase maturation protease [Thermoplasmata archaeon]|nr:hydrogenase maturation protease [Thermoplasmata archaeon]